MPQILFALACALFFCTPSYSAELDAEQSAFAEEYIAAINENSIDKLKALLTDKTSNCDSSLQREQIQLALQKSLNDKIPNNPLIKFKGPIQPETSRWFPNGYTHTMLIQWTGIQPDKQFGNTRDEARVFYLFKGTSGYKLIFPCIPDEDILKLKQGR